MTSEKTRLYMPRNFQLRRISNPEGSVIAFLTLECRLCLKMGWRYQNFKRKQRVKTSQAKNNNMGNNNKVF